MGWADHGLIISQTNIPWMDASTYSMWAPDCVEKEGKYYCYLPANDQSGDFGIGVAVADTPTGPFKPEEPKPIENVVGIDPCVLIDTNENASLYYSRGKILVARQKNNLLDHLPTQGLQEDPLMLEQNGIYYLAYPHVEKETERLEYSLDPDVCDGCGVHSDCTGRDRNGIIEQETSRLNGSGQRFQNSKQRVQQS